MTRHREFHTARAEAAGDPITFAVDGETFTVGGLEAGPVLDLVTALPEGIDVSDTSLRDAAAMLPALSRFVSEIVVEEDRERWTKTMRHVTPQTFMGIVAHVIEEATGRPLPMSSSAQPSAPAPTATSSSASESSAGETP